MAQKKKLTRDSEDQTIALSDQELMFSIYQKQSGSIICPFLDCVLGDQKGKRFLLDANSITIGREDICNIVLNDSTVSRTHAIIYREGDDFFIRDEKSHNGTFVNDSKIDRVKLSAGDLIHVGESVFKLVYPQK